MRFHDASSLYLQQRGRLRCTGANLGEDERDVLDAIFGLHLANMERILQPLDQPTREQLASGLRLLLESFGDTSLS